MKTLPGGKGESAKRNLILAMELGLFGAFLAVISPCARAFSLLGPYAPWMDEAKSFSQPGRDIGGPMDIGEGYRWNAPVVTYGFDKSFLEFFGSNGVAAVESAIDVLNNLPPASELDPANYPTQVIRVNFQAASQGL